MIVLAFLLVGVAVVYFFRNLIAVIVAVSLLISCCVLVAEIGREYVNQMLGWEYYTRPPLSSLDEIKNIAVSNLSVTTEQDEDIRDYWLNANVKFTLNNRSKWIYTQVTVECISGIDKVRGSKVVTKDVDLRIKPGASKEVSAVVRLYKDLQDRDVPVLQATDLRCEPIEYKTLSPIRADM
jgi:hypothetical protein